MVRKNLLNFKLNIPNFSSDQLFSEFMNEFKPELERCPSCGAVGQCRRFAYYNRGLVDAVDGEIVFRHIRILRVKCSCEHTHGIIPDFIVPYRRYSLPFILHILKLYFSGKMTIEAMCETYEFSHSTLYRWRDAFAEHMKLWLDAVVFIMVTFFDFLSKILATDPISDFLRKFFERTLMSFLQIHANPANCRQMPPGYLPCRGDTT